MHNSFLADIFIQFNKISETVSESDHAVVVGITGSNPPQISSSFEVILHDGTANGIDHGLLKW